MEHRHLDLDPSTPVEELPLDALDDLLERGDLGDWRELAAAIRRDPGGALAARVLRLCRAHDMYGTSKLWPAFIEAERAAATTGGHVERPNLAGLRARRGLSQAAVAEALGISQSDVSKLERRSDLRLSTLRRYLAALGGTAAIVVRIPGEDPVELQVGGASG